MHLSRASDSRTILLVKPIWFRLFTKTFWTRNFSVYPKPGAVHGRPSPVWESADGRAFIDPNWSKWSETLQPNRGRTIKCLGTGERFIGSNSLRTHTEKVVNAATERGDRPAVDL